MVRRRTYLKRIIALAIVVVLILAAPLPFRVDFSDSGFRLYNDMSEKRIIMTVDGWRWRSLTGFDRMVGKVEIKDPDNESIIYEFIGHVNGFADLLYYTLSRYESANNRMTFATMYSNKDFDTFLVSHLDIKECFDVASVDSVKNGYDLLGFFRSYIWLHF